MRIVLIKKAIAAAVSISMVLPSAAFTEAMGSSVGTSAGDIAADGSTRTGVDRAQNGVPLVNIAPPSGAGVSHNRYQDFNVGSEGAIMNNSSRMDNSLLGGAVYANPNLIPGQEGARVILNEVTSTRESRLLGATEIHGRAAEYILANPNGITCNGCEFINTPRVLLGTGRPEMRNGDFMGLHMDPAGQVNIEGAGLNAGNVDFFEIITRAAKVNAEIHANELNLKTGNRYYDAKTGELTSGDLTDANAPALSVDSVLLGGIAAGRITLVSTEQGVGVNLGGQLASRQDLEVTADGKIVYAGVASETGSVAVRSKGSAIEQTGYAAAENDVALEAAGGIKLDNGTVSAGADVRINAGGDFLNQAVIQAQEDVDIRAGGGVSNQADISSHHGVDISAGHDAALNSGRIIALESVDVSAGGNIENKAEVEAGQNVALAAVQRLQNEGTIAAGTDVKITAGQGAVFAAGEVAAQHSLAVDAKGDILNSAQLQAGDKITLKSDRSITHQGGKLLSNGDVEMTAGQDVELADGQVLAIGDISVQAQGSFSNGAELTAGRNVILQAQGSVSNDSALMAGGNADLSAGKDIELEGGKVLANHDLSLRTGGALSNNAQILSGGNAAISAHSLKNRENGKIVSNGNLDMDIIEDSDFEGGEAAAGGDMRFTSGGSFTNEAVIQSGRHAAFEAGREFLNQGVVLAGTKENEADPQIGLQIQAGSLANLENGRLLSYGTVDISVSGGIDIESGQLAAGRDLNMDAKGGLSNKAEIRAGGNAVLSADAISNGGNGSIVAFGDLDMNANGDVDVSGGETAAHGNLNIAAGGDVNLAVGEVVAGGDIQIVGKGNLTNQTNVRSGRNLAVAADMGIVNRGVLLAGNDLALAAAVFTNDPTGKVLSYGNADLTASENMVFAGGEMAALKDITLNTGSVLNNAELHADGKLTLTASRNFTNQRTLTAGTADKAGDATTGIRIEADAVHNGQSGNLLSHGGIDMSVNQDLDLAGQIFSQGDMNISGNGSITNGTDIQAERKVNLTAGSDIRNNGTITAGQRGDSATGIALDSNALWNNGKLLSFGDTQLTVRQDLDLTGQIVTHGDLAIRGDKNITNAIDLATGGRTDITAGLDFINHHGIRSDGSTAISAQNITNYGSIETGGNLVLAAEYRFLNDRRASDQGLEGNALILSRGDTSIYGNNIVNSGGEILSMGDITLQKDAQGNKSDSVENNSIAFGAGYTPAVIEADRDVTIKSRVLNNRSYDYGSYWIETVRVGDPGDEFLRLVYEDQARSGLKAQPAFITAGRDLAVYGAEVLNHASSLSAGRNLTLNGGGVNNEDYKVTVGNLARVYMNRHYVGSGLHVIYDHTDYYAADIVPDFRPVLYAGGNLTVESSGQVSNGSPAIPHQKAVSSANLESVRQTGIIPTVGIEMLPAEEILSASVPEMTSQGSDIPGSPARVIAFEPKTAQAAYAAVKSPVSISDDSLFNLSALFGLSKNPGGRYVIESRSQYTSIDGLKGSQYFLDRIGYNPHTDAKLLGDDHFQAKLIERSIREATGRVYLEQGVGSALDQLETLYNNAFEEFKDHQLSVGSALSAAQIMALKSDIVWLVETEVTVNGKTQKVLVPQIYLARATRDNLKNPEALMQGDMVSIRSRGDVVNSGGMEGGQSLRVDAEKDIKNLRSDIVAKGGMALIAGGDILNDAGKISAGKDMLLDAQGSVTSANLKVRKGIDHYWNDKIAAHGTIEAGGSAVISAGKDVNILGSGLQAVGDLGLSAGNDVNIVADRLDSHFHVLKGMEDGSYEHEEDSTRHVLAGASAGGDIQIRSGKDITVIGGNLDAGDSMELESKGALTVASVQDRKFTYTARTRERLMSSEVSVNSSEKTKNDSASLKAGSDFTSISGGNTNITGSDISAGGSGTMTAGGQLNILSATESDSNYSYHKETNGFDPAAMALGTVTGLLTGGPVGALAGLQTGAMAERGEIRENESYHTHEAASNLKFGDDLTLVSAGDINIISSKLKSRNLSALGEGKLLIGTKEEIHTESQTVEEIKPDYAGVAAGAAVSGFVAGLAGAAGGVLAAGAGYAVAGLGAGYIASMGAGKVATKTERSASGTLESKSRSSDITTDQSMELSGRKEILVSASRLKAGGDVFLESDGDVNITAGRESFTRKEGHSETGFGGFSVGVNRSSLDMNWSQTGAETEKDTSRVTVKQSELSSGGGVSIRSGHDANLVSSNLYAGGKVSIEAGNDVNLMTAKESETVTERKSEFKNTFTQSIGNSWIETGFAAHDAVRSAKEAAGAETGGPMKQVNVAVSAGKVAVEAYQVAKTAKNAAGSAATAGTFGFYTDFSVKLEKETNSTTQENAREIGSRLQSTDMEIAANRDIAAKGVDLIADGGDLLLKAGRDVRVESSEDSVGTRTAHEKETLKIILASSKGNFLPGMSLSQSEALSSQVTQNNSVINATHGTVKVESGGNTDLLGVNVRAQKVDMTGIGGNLTLASKQDREESGTKEYSIALGGEKVGFSIGESRSDERWTRSPSSIIGTESVDIKAKELNLAGAVIAHERSDGKDGENMNITVDRLNYEDLKDSLESSHWKYGLGVGLSKSGDTDLSAAYGGRSKEGVTLATLGEGNIVVKDHPMDVFLPNRDIKRTQNVTKDEQTGGLDIDVSISNKLIADVVNDGLIDAAGKKLMEMKETFTGLPENAVRAGKRVGDAGGDLKRAVENAYKDDVNLVLDYDAATDFRQATLDFQKDRPELAEVLNNKDGYGTAVYQKAMQGYVDYVTVQTGASPVKVSVYAKADIYKGRSDNNSPNVLINAFNTNLRDTSDMLHVLGHEVGHKINGHGENDAERGGDKLSRAWSSENGYNGNEIGLGSDYALMTPTYADRIGEAMGDKTSNQVHNSSDLTIPIIGWVDMGEAQGEKSAGWYADKYNESGTAGKIAYGALGSLSSLWTKDTSDATFTILTSAWGSGPASATENVVNVVKSPRKLVIGENMSDRVMPAANKIGAKYYKPTSKIEENWLTNNRKMMTREIKKGTEFFDIGIDPNRAVRSEFYKMEKGMLEKNNIIPIKLNHE